jgi:hypothetical protein
VAIRAKLLKAQKDAKMMQKKVAALAIKRVLAIKHKAEEFAKKRLAV